jgi:hypothetical protein
MITRVRIPTASLVERSKVVLYEDINFAGAVSSINDSISSIPPPMGSGDGQASSVKIFTNEWVVLWENVNYQEGEDQLWIAPAGDGFGWEIADLRQVPRPHGNNNWNDRIRCVAFPGRGPTGDNDNRTIITDEAHVSVGNPPPPPTPHHPTEPHPIGG